MNILYISFWCVFQPELGTGEIQQKQSSVFDIWTQFQSELETNDHNKQSSDFGISATASTSAWNARPCQSSLQTLTVGDGFNRRLVATRGFFFLEGIILVIFEVVFNPIYLRPVGTICALVWLSI